MSQRLGMADGRCFTYNYSSDILNKYVLDNNNINQYDNYAYRRLLQEKGTAILPSNESQAPCGQGCTGPSLKISNTY